MWLELVLVEVYGFFGKGMWGCSYYLGDGYKLYN